MKVICAWCENEGKETLIRDIGLYDRDVTSHGICLDHEKVLFQQIQQLKTKQRLRRSRRPQVPPRSSGSPTVPHCTTPWRRRHAHRASAAQLSLPFLEDEVRVDVVAQELGLAPA